MSLFKHPIVRFVIGGGLNTGLSYGVYLVMLTMVSYRLAYTISFVAGMVLAYFINTRFVFQTGASLKKFLAYPLVYLVQYFFGLGAITLFVSTLGVDKRFASPLVLVLTIPLSFLLNRLALKTDQSPLQ